MHNSPILHLYLGFELIELQRLWPCPDLVDENDEVPILYQTLSFYPYVGVHLLSGYAIPLEKFIGVVNFDSAVVEFAPCLYTDHLYDGLKRKGISTFRDDEKLERGTPIGPGLFKAIEESRFAVVILSSDYASLRWCLIELAKIVDCMKKTRLIVLPVFHYVDPSGVRNQGEIYAEAFKKHEELFKDSNKEDVHMWKAALTEVASIAGWDLRDRRESKVIQEIVGTISSELNRRFSKTISKNLVGIDSRVEEMLDYYLCEGLGVRFVGICVLIVLDDVYREEQLEALARKQDWFGLGIRIILTSRDSHLLIGHGMDALYNCKGLNDDEALELFSWRVFKKRYPKEGYVELSKDFVNYAFGIPLAITSFDGLMETQKELFLDIVCSFEEENINCIRDIQESSSYHPNYNIDVLMDTHLINIYAWGTIRMNVLLQFMGQEIVRRESPKEPGKRCRLWRYEDVFHVLENDTGTESIEGIVQKAHVHKKERLNVESLSKMKKLRLLEIQDVLLPNHLNYLSNELHIIEWHGCPLNSMPANFQPNKLVELKMHCSAIIQLWKGIVLMETPDFSGAPSLKHLILQCCTRLYKIHASIKNLRRLIQLELNGCKCLEILPPKISLESLKVFDLSGCSSLKKFPVIVGNMSCLSKLDLDKSAIKELPASA
ncbi:TMV resistance protein N-like [Quercus lobata]|uniref:TMV resistance protein N-like n=1 Tax=Quercus lobata TaxID=97700 RepID=UPI0012465E81|nr:TMV resistance protein N-like [Quercus lobata]